MPEATEKAVARAMLRGEREKGREGGREEWVRCGERNAKQRQRSIYLEGLGKVGRQEDGGQTQTETRREGRHACVRTVEAPPRCCPGR